MNNGLNFLIQTLFDLYMMAVILRIWMQLVRADYFNPFSQFIVKITDPLLRPLRMIIPTFRNFDLAAAVLTLLISWAKYIIIVNMVGYEIGILQLLTVAGHNVVISTLQLMFWILIVRAILSWFSQGRSPVEFLMHQLTEPMLAPIRRIIPPIGGLDLSVLVLIILIQFIRVTLS